MAEELNMKILEAEARFQKGEFNAEDYTLLADTLASAEATVLQRSRAIDLTAKYAKHFPEQLKGAFAAQMAVLDGEEAALKKAVRKSVEAFFVPITAEGAEGNANTVVADSVPQLLEKSFDKSELATEMLQKMVHADPTSVVACCVAILQSAQGEAREFTLKFLLNDVLAARRAELAKSPETEMAIKGELEKLMCVVGKAEFSELLKALKELAIAKTDAYGSQGIVDTLAGMLDKEADVTLDDENYWQVERLLSIAAATTPFLAKKGTSDKSLALYITQKYVAKAEVYSKLKADDKVQLLQRLAELASSAAAEQVDDLIDALAPVALEALPARPAEGEETPDHEFAVVESLLAVLTALGKVEGKKERLAGLLGCSVAPSEEVARKDAAATVKSKEVVEAEKAFKDRVKYAHERASELLLQLTQARQKIHKSEVADKDAHLAEVRRSIAVLEVVVKYAAAIAATHSFFPQNVQFSWRERRGGAGQKRSADSGAPPAKRAHTDGNKGGAKGGAKGAKGAKGGKGGKKGGKGGKKGRK